MRDRWRALAVCVSLVALTTACDVSAPSPASVGSAYPPSNWQLAQALPAQSEFPDSWAYELVSSVSQTAAATPTPVSAFALGLGRFSCTSGNQLADLNATAVTLELSPADRQGTAHFRIWHVVDGPGMVDDFAAYAETLANGVAVDRTLIADAAVAIEDGDVYTVYHAAGGVLLQLCTTLAADDRELVRGLVSSIVPRLSGIAGESGAAPGLAALSGDDLLGLLPDRNALPGGWTLGAANGSDAFGYLYQPPPSGHGDCAAVGMDSGPRWVDAASVTMNDSGAGDVRLAIARDFAPQLLTDEADLLAACSALTETDVRVIEDLRPGGGTQTLRFTLGGDASRPDSGSYYSYVRADDLVLAGRATPGNQRELDRLMTETWNRIQQL